MRYEEQGHATGGHICVDTLKHPAYGSSMTTRTEHLDALGLLCPLPVLKARKRLQSMEDGDVLTVLADDPAAIVDVPHFCTEAGHDLISSDIDGSVQTYLIRKRAS